MHINLNSMIAITRGVSPHIGHCELTHLQRNRIDVELAKIQHQQYEKNLTELGCILHQLPAEPNLPDSVFVEDTAVVLDELAIITRPGADSRKPETTAVAEALKSYRRLFFIEPPGQLDGGDVLVLKKFIYIGLSSRSNLNALEQVTGIVKPYGYEVDGIEVEGCLHLKSAITGVADNRVLINPAWLAKGLFKHMDVIEVHPSEPYAGNALWIGKQVIYPSAFPRTLERLEQQGIRCRLVDVSELAKAEGAVTCCSLIFQR